MSDAILQSSNLYRSPSFLKGVARIWDFSGSLDKYVVHPSEKEADRKALEQDWKMVGYDILSAIKQYGAKKIFNK